jgi:hypothetical protein
MSFLVVPWLVLVTSESVTRTVAAVGAQTVAYLIASPLGARLVESHAPRLSLLAELASVVAISAVAFAYPGLLPLLILAALVGGVRAVADRSRDATRESLLSTAEVMANPPPRESLITVLTLIGGAAVGSMVALLGAAGGLWLTAVACAAAAAVAVGSAAPTAPEPEVGLAPGREPEGLAAEPRLAPEPRLAAEPQLAPEPGVAPEPRLAPDAARTVPTAEWSEEPSAGPARGPAARTLAALGRSPRIRRLAVALFCVNVLGQAGAVALLGGLGHGVLTQEAGGFAAGAFVIGAIGAAVVLNAYAYQPTRWAALALGYLSGGSAFLITGGVAPIMLLVFGALVVGGIALGSVTPSTGMVVADRVPPGLRGRAGGMVAVVTHVGLPLGTFGGALFALDAGLVPAIVAATVTFLVIALIPLVILRAWREVMPEQAPPGVRGPNSERLRARMSVTLAYADGQWLVEVRRGRALLGTRHVVNSADALRTLALLDVPTVQHGVGRVLSTDQDEAARQVQRARNELAELEARLSGLREMVDLTDNIKPN